MRSWSEIRDEGNGRDPGRIARVDQEKAALAREYNRLRWRIARAWDELRGKNKL